MSMEVEVGWLNAKARLAAFSNMGLAQPILETGTFEEEDVPNPPNLNPVPSHKTSVGEASHCDILDLVPASNDTGHCSRMHAPDLDPNTSGQFIMTSIGEPQSLVLSDALDPTSFTQLVMLPLGKAELASTLCHRRTRLAKKECNHTLVIVAAQNVLIHKLGQASGQQMDMAAFEKYITLFQEGLSEEQAKMVVELITSRPPKLEI
jgi:hypothetical protein